MVVQMVKTISSKILVWLLILSVLYSISCLLDVKRSSRILVKTSEMDYTLLTVWCHFHCLVVAALLFQWQLGKVDANKPSLLNSWVTTAAFMIVFIPFITRASLNLGLHLILGRDAEFIHPVVLKWIVTYSVFTLSLMYRQLRLVTASWLRALKVVVFLVAVWSASVFLMTCCYLRLGLHKMSTRTETLVDVTHTSYGHLLLASFFIFLVVDYCKHRTAATCPFLAGLPRPQQQVVPPQPQPHQAGLPRPQQAVVPPQPRQAGLPRPYQAVLPQPQLGQMPDIVPVA